MKVKDIMVKDVVTLTPEDSFYEIVQLFSEKKISGAPVAISDKPVGMVSESDIMKFITKKELIPLMEKGDKGIKDKAAMQAKQFMTKKLVFVKPGDSLSAVLKIMNDNDINRVPVVEGGKLKGIITRADVVSVISEYLGDHPGLRKRQLETDRPLLETNIDKLLQLVKDERKIKFSKAAKSFEVDESKIEEWGKILEGYKLVRLHYPPIGNPLIIIYEEKKHAKKK